MALLTPMSLAEARSLAAAHGIDVDQVDGLARGINSNFVLRIAGGVRVFARVCERCTSAQVAAQASLLEHLAGAGVRTPRPLRRIDGAGAVSHHTGKPTLLFPFCEGRELCQRSVRGRHTEQLGRALAQMHEATVSFDYPVRSGWGLADLSRQIHELRRRTDLPALQPDLISLSERIEALAAHQGSAAVPETVVHGDLFRDNVLWSGQRLSALLDFEFASRDAAGYDLMVTMLAWCFSDRLERPLARALVGGYRAVRELGPAAVASLFPQAQRAALRFAVSRIGDYELRPREAIEYKDYRRFLARHDELDRIG